MANVWPIEYPLTESQKILQVSIDGMGCHWCGRSTKSITEGHDGFCPVPVLKAVSDLCWQEIQRRRRDG